MKHLLTIISLVLLASCGQQKTNLKDEEEKIVQCWVDWPKKAITGDPELGAYYFADSAVVMGQGQPTIKGKGELGKFFSTFAKTPGLKVNWGPRPKIIDFSEDGSMAYSVDIQELTIPDSTGTVTLTNQALHVWKKESNGDWRVSFVMMYPRK